MVAVDCEFFLLSTRGDDLLLFISALRLSLRCLITVFSKDGDSRVNASAGRDVAGLGRWNLLDALELIKLLSPRVVVLIFPELCDSGFARHLDLTFTVSQPSKTKTTK